MEGHFDSSAFCERPRPSSSPVALGIILRFILLQDELQSPEVKEKKLQINTVGVISLALSSMP